MKKINLFLALAALVVASSSCDMISGVELTDQQSINKKMPAKFEKDVDPESTVFEVAIGTTSDFSTEMDVATVTFIPPGETERKKLSFTMTGNQKPREQKVLDDPKIPTFGNKTEKEEPTGVKLKDVDFSQIASNVAKATEIMTEMGYTLDGIKSYTMTVDAKPENTIHTFSTRSKEGTDFGTQNGRAALVTNYYEFHFTADAAGNVTYKE